MPHILGLNSCLLSRATFEWTALSPPSPSLLTLNGALFVIFPPCHVFCWFNYSGVCFNVVCGMWNEFVKFENCFSPCVCRSNMSCQSCLSAKIFLKGFRWEREREREREREKDRESVWERENKRREREWSTCCILLTCTYMYILPGHTFHFLRRKTSLEKLWSCVQLSQN